MASYLFIPQLLNVPALADVTFEAGGPLSDFEIIWRLLVGLFPETSTNTVSWRNLAEARRQTFIDLAAAQRINAMRPDSLFLLMLDAAYKRNTVEARRESRRVAAGVFDVWCNLLKILAADPDRAEAVRGQSDAIPVTPVDGGGMGRSLVAPIIGDLASARRLPLVRGDSSRNWVNVLDINSPARTEEEWQALMPDHALVFYPFRPIPQGRVYAPEARWPRP